MADKPISIITASHRLTEVQQEDITSILMNRLSLLAFIPTDSQEEGLKYHSYEMMARSAILKGRAFNETTDATEEKIRERDWGLVIYEDKAVIEKPLFDRNPKALYDQLLIKMEYFPMDMNDIIINGNADANAKELAGFKAACGTPSATNGATLNAGVGSANINVTSLAGLKSLLSAFDKAMRQVVGGVNAFIMSQAVYDGIQAGCREFNFNPFGASVNLFNEEFVTYKGRPLLPMGENSAQQEILGMTESDAGGSNTSSIYAGHFNVRNGIRFWTGSGIEIIPYEIGLNQYEHLLLVVGLVVPTRSLARICRISFS